MRKRIVGGCPVLFALMLASQAMAASGLGRG